MASAPLFSKRHYEWLARHLRDELSSCEVTSQYHQSMYFTIRHLAQQLQRDNPRFDSERFIIACCDSVADRNALLGREVA